MKYNLNNIEQAYDLGANAAKAGKTLNHNPYDIDNDPLDYLYWSEGWYSGQSFEISSGETEEKDINTYISRALETTNIEEKRHLLKQALKFSNSLTGNRA